MLKNRIIPASILILLISGLFYLDHYFKSTIGFTALLCLVGAGALYEFYKMYENIGIKLPKVFPIVITISWIILNSVILKTANCCAVSDVWLLGVAIFLVAASVYYLFYLGIFHHIFILIVGFIYIVVPLIYSQCYYEWSPEIVIYLIVTTKLSDSLAYFGGKAFGKHKLAPTISPNKTVEGFIIGLLGGTILGGAYLVVVHLYSWYLYTWLVALLLSFVIAFFGQMGDLLESMFKRHCQVKDSGRLLIGLGGVLDTIDSLLLTIPITFMFMHGSYSLVQFCVFYLR